jgi:hypothetical protein
MLDKLPGNWTIILRNHLCVYRVPYFNTEARRAADRAKQASVILYPGTEQEIEALSILTKAGCSSSPALVTWKQEQQGKHDWVPGGYIVYILMSKVPGIRVHPLQDFSLQEREAIRTSFKEAWQ